MGNPMAMSLLASRADLDFVFLCSEHMPLDRSEMSMLCQLFASKGISPIVRIPQCSGALAAMALDGGAQGIVVPYVETVEQVREIVGAVHYRPVKGKMLDEYLSGRRNPPAKMEAFLRRFNRNHYVIIGIESMEAYENLDALIGVEGVDGVFIGPHDVTVSLEAPEEWDNPDLHDMVRDTVRRCRMAGIGVGAHVSPSAFPLEKIKELMDAGMNWILDAADVVWAVEACNSRRRQLGIAPVAKPAVADVAAPKSCISVE